MIDYKEFPIICSDEFEAVSFDCSQTDNGYYYLMLTFFKNFADDDTGERAQGFTLATSIRARTLQEIDAQCGVLFDTGLFNHLHIDSHGTLFGPDGDTVGPICWNTINESATITADAPTEPIAHTLQ